MKRFRVSKFSTFILVCIFTTLLACQSSTEQKPDEDVLAQINDLSVSTAHFKNAFKEYYYKTGRVLGQDNRTKEAILNSTFGTYVLATHAKDLGLDETDRAVYKKGAIERRVLTEEYLNQVILKDVTVSEEEVRDYFVRFNSQLRASHIYARTEEEINALYDRLQNGESFEALAKEVFQNPYLANNGGDIGHFSTDELDIAFENQAYDMRVGYVSEPVRTAQGYSIIKLTERVTKPIILESEFATAKENLTDYAYQKKDELVQREHMYNFIDNIEFDEEVFNSIWMAIQADFSGMLNKDSEFTSRLSEIDEALATSNGFEFSMDQFVEEYLVSDPPLLNTIQDKKSLEDFIKGTAYRAYMVQEARREGIDDQDLVESSIEETWLNFLSMEATDYLRNSITNTPAELFNFYEANKTDFYQPAQINLQRLVLKTEEDANRMLELLDEGASFKELVTTYTINNDDLFTNGVLGFASVKSYGFMATKLANLEKDEISEVLQYQNNEYHIYKMLDRVEAKPLSFNEAKDQVDQLLTRQKLNELRAETIENVKERHDAVVDLEKLKELTIQI